MLHFPNALHRTLPHMDEKRRGRPTVAPDRAAAMWRAVRELVDGEFRGNQAANLRHERAEVVGERREGYTSRRSTSASRAPANHETATSPGALAVALDDLGIVLLPDDRLVKPQQK